MTKVENEFSDIRILDNNLSGKILFNGLKWTGKKNFNELLEKGDLIFAQLKSNNIW